MADLRPDWGAAEVSCGERSTENRFGFADGGGRALAIVFRTFTSESDRGSAGARATLERSWIDANLGHHAVVFMEQNVAMIDKTAGDVRVAEIHTQSYVVVGALTTPERDIDRVL